MDGVGRLPRTSAAGQASLEYVAVIALVAAILLVAGPAAGAPDIPRKVADAIRLGICVVASDVCSTREARAEGLAPCPLRSRTDGAEASVSFLSVDLGRRGTLTVTPQSDGTVAATLTEGGRVGFSGGLGGGVSPRPPPAPGGAGAGIGVSVPTARGWTLRDGAAAERFLAELPASVDDRRYPPAWASVEGGADVAARLGASRGRGADGAADFAGGGAGAALGVGARLTRDGLTTVYVKATADAGVALSLFPDVGTGPVQLMAEYTSGPDGPRELAFRRATPSRLGNRMTETVARLDLRDPANWEVARPLVERLRGPSGAARDVGAALERIRVAGVTERYVSDVRDESAGAGVSLKLGVKLGVSAQRIRIRRQLVGASAWTAGSDQRQRFDCTAQLR